MPRIAAEPFMRVVGEMLDLEEETAGDEIIDAEAIEHVATLPVVPAQQMNVPESPANPPETNRTAPILSEQNTPRDRDIWVVTAGWWSSADRQCVGGMSTRTEYAPARTGVIFTTMFRIPM